MEYSRYIGLDLHKKKTVATFLNRRGKVLDRTEFASTPEGIRAFAETLTHTDAVAVEATTNAIAVRNLLAEHAGEVVISNPLKTRAIAEGKLKSDKVDSETLAQLLRVGYLPTVWVPDPATMRMREMCTYRTGLVRERTQLKNRIHAVLHRNLVPRPEVRDLFGKTGREYLAQIELPPGDAFQLRQSLTHLDFLEEQIKHADTEIAKGAVGSSDTRLLMTLPGVSLQVAAGLIAAVGDVTRFANPKKLVSYLGLDPLSRSSAGETFGPTHISRKGRSHARWLLVEAATAGVRTPGPLQSFYQRLRAKKCHNKAIVATARKMVHLTWHMLTSGEPYRYAPPVRTEQKIRTMEIMAGSPRKQGGVPKGVDPRTVTDGRRQRVKRDWDLAKIAQAQYEELVRERARREQVRA